MTDSVSEVGDLWTDIGNAPHVKNIELQQHYVQTYNMKSYERQIGLMPEVLRLICMSEAEMSGGRLGEAVSSPDWLIISIDGHFSPPLPAIRPLRRISGLSILNK